MGFLDKIIRRPHNEVQSGKGFQTFTETTPIFTQYSGRIYEQELTRAAIERFATACSKLKPEIVGSANRAIVSAVNTQPNEFMTWSTFLKRLGAIFDIDGTAFVVAVLSPDGERTEGYFPLSCEVAEIVEYHGKPWVIFNFATGERSAIELEHVAILTKFQYSSDLLGEVNCLGQTMNLIHAQNEAQTAAIKNGARIRFIGSLTGQVREEDMKKKRERFIKDNLTADNANGLMLYDQTFDSIKQIEPQSYVISDSEMQRIEDNVCTYFGISKPILQNNFTEEQWDAWYEGRVEPFAIALSEGLTALSFTKREQLTNRITFSSNRLEYASSASKRNMVRDMVDRGIMTINEGREILQLPPLEDGDTRIIRGEYKDADVVTFFGKDVAVNDADLVDANMNEHDTDLKKPDYNPEYGDVDN